MDWNDLELTHSTCLNESIRGRFNWSLYVLEEAVLNSRPRRSVVNQVVVQGHTFNTLIN